MIDETRATGPANHDLLSRDQLAERWHVSTQFVTRRYAKLGLIPVVIGNRVLFRMDNVLEVEKRNTRGAFYEEKRGRGRTRAAS